MKSLLMALIAAFALIFAPGIAVGQMDEAAGTTPPISQPLVREGSLAVALAQALQVGTVTDEAAAESLLSSAGISPRNGWIADYPVTPEIIGDLHNEVVVAAESGKLKMNKEDAVSAFQDVADKYGLSVKEEESGGGGEVSPAPSYSDNPEINDYYYDEGPPVVTYYAPPPAYAYLYDWVPYPFWWSDFWFPGFFVLVDFDRTVIVHGHHHHFSNHFFDRDRDRFARIAPEHRFHEGSSAGDRNGFRGGAVRGRRDVAGGMSAITRWRNGFSTGSRSFNVSTGGGTQVRQPYRGRTRGTFIAPSGGHRVTTGEAALNSSRQFHPSSNIRQQNAPARIAPSVNSMRPSGSYNRSFGGGRTFSGASHWEGGHSFGGFRGSSGGGFRR